MAESWDPVLTFRPEVFHLLEVIHILQRLGFFAGKSLLIIILARAPKPVQQNPPSTCMPEKVEDREYQNYEGGRAEGGQQSDEDPPTGRLIVGVDVNDNVGPPGRCVGP